MSGDRINPTVVSPETTELSPQAVGHAVQKLRRCVDFLQHNSRVTDIGMKYDKYRRYVIINADNIFAQLVTLYATIFRSLWNEFRTYIGTYTVPNNVEPWVYAARVYLSHWLFDLYPSIRDSVRPLSPIAHAEKFTEDSVTPFSMEYDVFLVLLNAHLRPTHIRGLAEDTLFIPVIADNMTWSENKMTGNPFGITNFILENDLFYGLINIMKNRKVFDFATITTNALGRPFWLFDWFSDYCCAWFPRENNYNNDDTALAYIIGVACTPKLGMVDYDSWQFPPGGVIPSPIDPTARVDPRRVFGRYEVHQVETDRYFALPEHIVSSMDSLFIDSGKRRRRVTGPRRTRQQLTITDGSTSQQQTEDVVEVNIPYFNRYRLVTWCYYARLTQFIDMNTRVAGLKMLITNS